VLRYADEGSGPRLADLSHLPRWDIQDRDLTRFRPCDVDIPNRPGSCALENGVLVNRMNRTQAAVWHLAPAAPALPGQSAYTDVTEAAACLALFGPHLFSITEKLTPLDFLMPGQSPPFLLQGPFCRVPCQIVVLGIEDGAAGGVVLTCSRGYAADMAAAILAAGEPFGLRPAGEKTFRLWLEKQSAGGAGT
jgi:glycine cleavage system aminomethyltransferase T